MWAYIYMHNVCMYVYMHKLYLTYIFVYLNTYAYKNISQNEPSINKERLSGFEMDNGYTGAE